MASAARPAVLISVHLSFVLAVTVASPPPHPRPPPSPRAWSVSLAVSAKNAQILQAMISTSDKAEQRFSQYLERAPSETPLGVHDPQTMTS